MKGTDWQMFRDVREAAGSEVYHTDAETDCRVLKGERKPSAELRRRLARRGIECEEVK